MISQNEQKKNSNIISTSNYIRKIVIELNALNEKWQRRTFVAHFPIDFVLVCFYKHLNEFIYRGI